MDLSALVTGGAGLLTGAIGSFFSSLVSLVTTKQKNKHELNMIEARIKEMEAEAKLHIEELNVKAAIQRDVADSTSFDLSQRLGNKELLESSYINKLFESKFGSYIGYILVMLMGLVDILRTVMRPAITIIMMVITASLVFNYYGKGFGSSLTVSADQLMSILDSIEYLTFSIIGWWFGDRAIMRSAKGR